MAKRQTATVIPTPAIVAAPRQPGQVRVVDNIGKIIDAIVKIAGDPTVDSAKMKQMEEMYVRMVAQAAKVEFDERLAQMQPELPIIDRKGRIEIRKKDAKGDRTGPIEQSTAYALWEDINQAITPILSKYGFSLSFRTPMDPNGKIMVTAILARGGHREETTLPFQHDSTGSKNAAQAVVSATSYGKRVTACLLLNITTRGEDDDAKKTEGLEPISQGQLEELLKLVKESGADQVRFCNMMGVGGIAHIQKIRFQEAKNQLMRKLRDRKAREKADAEKKTTTADHPDATARA